ncbi:hypothetical protein NKJ35_12760 [Mesorhizobium sp. M0136]|uniref:hypothetical protein n=1 Tax=Mesorhizobium sp. M0136 TaxID=2956890 RepID=UPI003335D07F
MDQTTPIVTELDDGEEERDSPFNAYRFAASENTKAIVQEAIGLLLNCEAHVGLRTNKRRNRDQETFDLTVDAVLSDLMHHHVAKDPGAPTAFSAQTSWRSQRWIISNSRSLRRWKALPGRRSSGPVSGFLTGSLSMGSESMTSTNIRTARPLF